MWIEPLALETWIVNVFSGNYAIFTAVALLFITMMAAFFRMTGLITVFMVTLFLIMFKDYISQDLLFLTVVIGGYAIGYWIKEIIGR